MLVRNWMSKIVITIEEDDSLQGASALMREHHVRMLPVMRKGQLIGIISRSDLNRASASDATMLDIQELLHLIAKIKVSEIMSKHPITIPEDFTVEETAQVLMDNDISGVPVLNCDGKLVGMITRDDILKILMSLSGLGKKGIQFAFQVDDRAGSIKALADVIRKYDGLIASILSTCDYAPEGMRIVYIRIYEIDRSIMPEMLRELRENGTLIYMVDHRDNKRQIFLDAKA